ncbi:glycine-rich domain-containing protein [Streptomyces sp. NPDC054940]
MSTAVTAEPRTGRSLVTDTEFAMLAAFCADEYGLERSVADRVVDQALALVFVMGSTGEGTSMAPSQLVDPGWHTLILHTGWYADWCQQHFGYFLHHQPNSKLRTRGLMTDVVDRIQAAGFEVDERLWGTAADCNAPSCCGDGPCC